MQGNSRLLLEMMPIFYNDLQLSLGIEGVFKKEAAKAAAKINQKCGSARHDHAS